MEDQLVIFAALAHGTSEVDLGKSREASLHTQTCQWVATQLLGTCFEDGKCGGISLRVGERPEVLKEMATLTLKDP